MPSASQKTKTQLKKNTFKAILSKAKKIFYMGGKSLKQETEQVETTDHNALWWKEVTGGESPGNQDPIKKTPEDETRKQSFQEEENVNFGSVNCENNAVLENPTGETKTQQEENAGDLFLQIRMPDVKGKRGTSPPRVSRDSDEERSLEQVQETMSPSGFDFQHLLVLQDFPLSCFYGFDFNSLDKPFMPPSRIQSLYGLDAESLAAENAALDELYAKKKSEKVASQKDQTNGNQCSEVQSQDLLFPESASEEDDDIKTMNFFFGYKLYFGSLPYVLDQPATTLDKEHPLVVYLNSKLLNGGCISESRLTDKVLKLQTKYKKLVAEKGNKTTQRQDFSTPGDYSFFRLSRMTWERDQESDVQREVDVHCKDNV